MQTKKEATKAKTLPGDPSRYVDWRSPDSIYAGYEGALQAYTDDEGREHPTITSAEFQRQPLATDDPPYGLAWLKDEPIKLRRVESLAKHFGLSEFEVAFIVGREIDSPDCGTRCETFLLAKIGEATGLKGNELERAYERHVAQADASTPSLQSEATTPDERATDESKPIDASELARGLNYKQLAILWTLNRATGSSMEIGDLCVALHPDLPPAAKTVRGHLKVLAAWPPALVIYEPYGGSPILTPEGPQVAKTHAPENESSPWLKEDSSESENRGDENERPLGTRTRRNKRGEEAKEAQTDSSADDDSFVRPENREAQAQENVVKRKKATSLYAHYFDSRTLKPDWRNANPLPREFYERDGFTLLPTMQSKAEKHFEAIALKRSSP